METKCSRLSQKRLNQKFRHAPATVLLQAFAYQQQVGFEFPGGAIGVFASCVDFAQTDTDKTQELAVELRA